MNKRTEEMLAKSLTAETTELLEYIPYLLQDLWEIGSSPEDMEELIKRNIKHYENFLHVYKRILFIISHS